MFSKYPICLYVSNTLLYSTVHNFSFYWVRIIDRSVNGCSDNRCFTVHGKEMSLWLTWSTLTLILTSDFSTWSQWSGYILKKSPNWFYCYFWKINVYFWLNGVVGVYRTACSTELWQQSNFGFYKLHFSW